MIACSHRTTPCRDRSPRRPDDVARPAECLACQESDHTQQSANWMLREAVIPRGASSGHTAPASSSWAGATIPARPPGPACAGRQETERAWSMRRRREKIVPGQERQRTLELRVHLLLVAVLEHARSARPPLAERTAAPYALEQTMPPWTAYVWMRQHLREIRSAPKAVLAHAALARGHRSCLRAGATKRERLLEAPSVKLEEAPKEYAKLVQTDTSRTPHLQVMPLNSLASRATTRLMIIQIRGRQDAPLVSLEIHLELLNVQHA